MGSKAVLRGSALLLAALLLLGAAPSQGALQKVNMGVYGAQVMDITAYDDSGSTALLIAVDGIKGVMKWDSSASRWTSVTHPSIAGKATEVEANLASGYTDDVYAVISVSGSGTALYGSGSGGAAGTWSAVSGVPNPLVLKAHGSGLYVGTSDGTVYRSTGGVSDPFDTIYSFGSGVEVVSLSVYDANTLFAVTRTGGATTTLYRLTASGGSFTASTIPKPGSVPCGSGSVEVHLIGVDPSDANTLFVAGSSANPQVYRSTDGGVTWSASWDSSCPGSASFPGGYPQYIKFDNNRVFIGASVLDPPSSSTWSHAPQLSSTVGSAVVTTNVNDGALEVDPIDSTIIYIGTDWGLGKMNHGSGGWTAGSELGNNDGMEAVVLNDMEFYEYSSTHKELWITAKSGAGRAVNFDPTDPTSTASPSDWIFPIYPGGDGAPPTEAAIDPSDPAAVLVGNNAGRVYRTTNGTTTPPTWTTVFRAEDHAGVFGTTRADHSIITSINFVPSTPTRVYLAGYNWETGDDGGVFYSDDGGATWTEDASITGTPVNVLWVTDSTVWAGVGNGAGTARGLRARTSVTASGNWWTPSTGTSLDGEIVTDIAGTTVGDYMTVYVATTGGVYKGVLYIPTSSGFSSWTWTSLTSAIGASSTDFTAVTVDPSDADKAYAAVSNCIYETTDGGSTWSVFGSSCTSSHEDVNVLKYDDIMAGTAIGLYTYTADTTATSSSSSTSSATTGSSSSSGDGGNCFIATAAYGSYLDPHVEVLRKFRDRYLLTNGPGRLFVAAYYRVSPPVARLIARHEPLRSATRWALTPLVYGAAHPRTSLLLLAGLACCAALAASRKRS